MTQDDIELFSEYQSCLQELCTARLYANCKPVSHGWLGKKHVDCIREGVEFLIARAEKAEAEVERLRAERDDDRRRDYGYSQQTVDAITREREQLRADAERYRWLKERTEKWHEGGEVWTVSVEAEEWAANYTGGNIDDAIDAAIASYPARFADFRGG